MPTAASYEIVELPPRSGRHDVGGAMVLDDDSPSMVRVRSAGADGSAQSGRQVHVTPSGSGPPVKRKVSGVVVALPDTLT